MLRHAPGVELLDDPGAEPEAVRTSLTNIARSNRLFGGTAAVLWGLGRLLDTRDPPRDGPAAHRIPHPAFSLLDLGTGAGDIPAAARAWGHERGIAVRTLGLERLRPAATLARGDALPVVLGCAGALPFRPRSVDVVTISQVLHHCDTPSAVALLRAATVVARRGVVVADLLRSTTAALLFGVASRALGFDRHTRVDGATSVARGYAPEELRTLCADAGVAADVTVRPGWRVVAWWRAP